MNGGSIRDHGLDRSRVAKSLAFDDTTLVLKWVERCIPCETCMTTIQSILNAIHEGA